jgi:O-antigen ligase
MALSNDRRILGFNTIEFFLLLAVVTIPFNNNLNSYCIVAFSLVTLFNNSIREKAERLKKNKIWLLLVAYFVWMALSFAFDPGPAKSLSILEKSVSFFVFPLLLGSIKPLKKESIIRINFLFAFAIIIAAFYCIWQAYLDYKETNYINVFFYHHLSKHISLNAIYFSLYSVFSSWILLYYCFFHPINIWLKALLLILVFFLVVFIVLLASKMLISLLIFSLFIVTLYSFFHFKQIRLQIFVLILLIATIPLVLIQFPYVKARINETKLIEYKSPADKYNGIAVRSMLWKAALKLIKEKPVFGYGYFAARHALETEYAKAKLNEAVKEHYNSHNQYLFTWANYGIIGLLLMTAYFVLFIKKAIREKHLLAVIFGCVFLVANLTECMLQGQKGIVFYTLFSSLFLFHVFERHSKQISM